VKDAHHFCPALPFSRGLLGQRSFRHLHCPRAFSPFLFAFPVGPRAIPFAGKFVPIDDDAPPVQIFFFPLSGPPVSEDNRFSMRASPLACHLFFRAFPFFSPCADKQDFSPPWPGLFGGPIGDHCFLDTAGFPSQLYAL